MRLSRGASLIALTLALIVPQLVSATNYRNNSRSIEIPILKNTPRPEGRTLLRVKYIPASNGKLTFRRTLEKVRGHLGVGLRDLKKKEREATSEPFLGVAVVRVERGSAAEKAGLLEDDIVLYAAEEAVSSRERLRYLIQEHDLIAPLKIEVERGERRITFEIQRELVTEEELDYDQIPLSVVRDRRHTGAVFGQVTGAAARYFFDEPTEGVMIMGIDAGSPLFYSDLRRGDLILSLDGRRVTRLDELLRALRRAGRDGDSITLTVRRGHATLADEVAPVDRLGRGFAFNIPLVIEWEKRLDETDFELVMGLVFDYRWSAYYSNGEPREYRGWSLPLNLFEYRNDGGAKRLELLWFIKFNW